ncbi:hypothetical protein GTP58_08415 [Duganella sp. CY15W]|uniref:hypothetical protein n=1 Tax=Duganella sp. CY15W TaxID=2692172 RepID=UPI00136B89AE|nr:hypothetical protein [Duganella sp. CY15W]MYM28345.1 hypothetical protein [Duganella sp. CY15W]
MDQLCIHLPINRDYEGEIWLEDGEGRILLGPFPISGRVADTIAAEHKNPTRDPLLPYGDPPTGTYKLVGIRETGGASKLRADLYGRSGAFVLLPWSGDAALADATGRFEILIHGGAPGAAGSLRMGSGHFRVSDATMAALTAHIEYAGLPQWVVCGETGTPATPAAGKPAAADALRAWTAHRPSSTGTRSSLAVSVGEYGPDGGGAIGDGVIAVNAEADAPSIIGQAGDKLIESARDLGLKTLDTYGGTPVPNELIDWTAPAAQLAGGLAGAGELLANGQTAAAYDAGKATLLEVIPGIAALVAVDIAAPTLIEATVAVGIGSAVAGMTLSAGAILVTSAVVTVGVAAAVAMGTEKLTKVIVDLADEHLH